MGRELWEIVRADEVKVGDFVSFGENCASGEITGIAPHYLVPGMVQTVSGVGGVMLDGDNVTVFRRVDPADDPRVLQRALDFAYLNDEPYDETGMEESELLCMRSQIAEWIDQARRELESEGQDGAAKAHD